ncbi:hypothetical protein DFP91_2926 [Pseudorhodoplanes sinuspersici]|nr:hypothetical protein DFP91_2926 [Pseudorhodoplanes sinuspersici]
MRWLFPALTAIMVQTIPSLAFAMSPAPLGELRTAIGERPIVQKVACWRYGWRGWGVYPGCYRPPVYHPPRVYVAPVYVAPPVYAPPRRCWINGRWRVC